MSANDDAVVPGREEGVFAAIAALSEVSGVTNIADSYRQAMRDAYWSERDLALALPIGYAGIARLLAEAQTSDDDVAYEARSAAKGLIYDVASFTWPGWDEPGIEISREAKASGLAAARTNLAMAVELDKGDLALSRGHWMIGAHLLTALMPGEAKQHFDSAADHASKANSDSDVALSLAFGALSDLAVSEPSAASDLADALERLEATDDGEMFVSQVTTARAVLDL